MLYPLKFEPIYKERIWGGNKLRENYNRMCSEDVAIGESWELSAVEDNVSVVSNGKLAGNDIQELIEVYMGELVGDRVYNTFGEEFPVLVKFLDARDLLSVQVHPDNDIAAERHNAYGKSEMWYIMDAEKGATLSLGFRKNTTRDEYLRHLEEGTVAELLDTMQASKGDMFLIPAGTIHSIGQGIFLAEIQQTSDITYRVFDWNRVDAEGNSRDLHTEYAVDVLNFDKSDGLKIKPELKVGAAEVAATPYFTANLLEVDGKVERDYENLDSFVIYVCVEGEIIVECEGGSESMIDAETVLLPAVFEHAVLSGKGKVIEVYMPK